MTDYEYGVQFDNGHITACGSYGEAMAWLKDDEAWLPDEARFLVRRPTTGWTRILEVNA